MHIRLIVEALLVLQRLSGEGKKESIYSWCSSCFAGETLNALLTPCSPRWRRPACPVGNALLALLATETRPIRNTGSDCEIGEFHEWRTSTPHAMCKGIPRLSEDEINGLRVLYRRRTLFKHQASFVRFSCCK